MNPFVFLLLALTSLTHATTDSFELDRQAILKTAGSFKVSFHFRETLAIKPGYQLTDPYNASAYELVKVVEDNGTQITLQHLLMVQPKSSDKKPFVIKHWAQTWKYEDTQILRFQNKRHWQIEALPKSVVKGTWSQYVSQVDDSPRYEGYGKWQHRGGRSYWVSDETTRPLPRREYKKRSDYDVLVCVNRHVVTDTGWSHEQHNAKLVRRDEAPEAFLAHEIGLNTYTRIDDYDFTAAEEYWKPNAPAWNLVRDAWEELYRTHETIRLQRSNKEKSLRRMTFAAVRNAKENGISEMDDIQSKLSEFVIN